MGCWYRQGGHWINHGLSQHVTIDRKPENGCEIQNAACGMSGDMLQLRLVKGADLPGSEEVQLHGSNVLKHILSPWYGSNRIVCADSYSACSCWCCKGTVL
jgi:hypothetical protein